MSDILLITPPFTQFNTPYPATPFLKGFFNSQGISSAQVDLSLETILAILTKEKLEEWFLWAGKQELTDRGMKRMLNLKQEYLLWINPVIRFLQGKEQSLAFNIVKGKLPQGKRFEQMVDTEWLFGEMGIEDHAKYLATLFLEDIGDFITQIIDPNFGFSRYAEHIGIKAYDFEVIGENVANNTNLTEVMFEILQKHIELHQPKLLALSIPFHGNLIAGLQCAKYVKENYPEIKISLGGGWVNTEIRQLNEPGLFTWVDFVCLDDGELPLLRIMQHINGEVGQEKLVRTFICYNGEVNYINDTSAKDFSHDKTGTPDYSGLKLSNYFSVLEVANAMHRLWSDGKWLKLMVAHGCYWAKCSFCDTSLPYIKEYRQADAKVLCDRMETMMGQTGLSGFHFVDEAAPPHILKALSLEIIERGLNIQWWANVRFEKAFNRGLCQLMAKAGCIAVSGGLEVAADRLLAKMQKGVTVGQVSAVCRDFQQSGIMVHAYLMYGFPTETAQETIDSLEVVRQLFELQLIQSGYWHRFAMTVHSPVGINPQDFGAIKQELPDYAFAQNDVGHDDPQGAEHEKFSFGLRKALYNYMHGQCFDFPLQDWFDFTVPHTIMPPNYIKKELRKQAKSMVHKPTAQVFWLSSLPNILPGKKGIKKMYFDINWGTELLEMPATTTNWLFEQLMQITESPKHCIAFQEFQASYEEQHQHHFGKFLKSEAWEKLQTLGIVVV
jgi:radical SAM superfamily enzyme YgiQ (UPF0313 family)